MAHFHVLAQRLRQKIQRHQTKKMPLPSMELKSRIEGLTNMVMLIHLRDLK